MMGMARFKKSEQGKGTAFAHPSKSPYDPCVRPDMAEISTRPRTQPQRPYTAKNANCQLRSRSRFGSKKKSENSLFSSMIGSSRSKDAPMHHQTPLALAARLRRSAKTPIATDPSTHGIAINVYMPMA